MRRVLLSLVPLFLVAMCSAHAGENVLLVLDASGSMHGTIEGRSKVDIARATVAGVVRDWKAEDHLGLIAYGHRRKGDCGDIETLIPVGPLDAPTYLRTVNSLGARGMTPLSAAVRQAAQALKWSEQKATVILVSDGEETCNLDPCATGQELEKSGVDFTAHVIAFDVGSVAQQAPLRCLASSTGGRYFNARDERELSAALRGAITASVEPPPPPAQATLGFEQPVVIAQPLSVNWNGPADHGDFIAFADPKQADNEYLTYSRMIDITAKNGSVVIEAPASPGAYELRYMNPLRGDAVLARAAVVVEDLPATLEAPETIAAGTRIKVIARGPHAARHWVGFAMIGSPSGSHFDFARLSGPVSEIELVPPAEPGDYELRYVLNENERIIVSRPITVVASEAMVNGPASVMAGDIYRFTARGPVDPGHWIGFAESGSGPGNYREYVRPTSATTEGILSAPDAPGDYELRYVLNEAERVVATQRVSVLPAKATMIPSGQPVAGRQLRVEYSGPRGRSIWIGFVSNGTVDEITYASVSADGDAEVELMAPDKAGSYELVYVLGGKAIERLPITVLAPEDTP